MATHILKTNTATRITVGPFLDKTDGVTPETALTVTSCKLTMTVDTAGVPTLVLDTNPTASGGNNDMVHITGDDGGMYDLELTAANLNYLGNAKVVITDAATHCPVVETIHIVPANVWDSLMGGTDTLQADVTQLLGTAWLTPGTAGTPDVNVKLVSGDATAADNIENAFDDTAGAVSWLGVVDQGTAQSISSADLTIRAAAAFGDDVLVGMTCLVYGSTQGYWQARTIVDNVGATDVVTLDSAPTVTPSGTISYKILGTPPSVTTAAVLPRVDVRAFGGTAATTASGRPEVNVTHNAGTSITAAAGIQEVKVASIAANAITATAIASDAITDAKVASDVTIASVTGAVGSVTGAVGSIGTGGITAASFGAGAIDAAAIAANAIGASELAADAVTEIAAGVLTVAMTESYAADGAAPTLAQAVFAIQQFLQEKSVSTTTLTVKKLDGTTTAMTFTLNDATTPTSITRAS